MSSATLACCSSSLTRARHHPLLPTPFPATSSSPLVWLVMQILRSRERERERGCRETMGRGRREMTKQSKEGMMMIMMLLLLLTDRLLACLVSLSLSRLAFLAFLTQEAGACLTHLSSSCSLSHEVQQFHIRDPRVSYCHLTHRMLLMLMLASGQQQEQREINRVTTAPQNIGRERDA